MKTTITNKIIIENPTVEITSWVLSNLVVTNPKYSTLAKLGKEEEARRYHVPPTLNLFIRKGNTLVVSKGCLYALWKYIKQGEYSLDFAPTYKINENHFIFDKNDGGHPELYDYQKNAVEALLKAKGGVLQAGCGAGKTILSCELFRQIGQRTLFLVHTGDLLRQAKKNFLAYFPHLKVGEITEGKVQLGEDITFATWQTMCKIDRDIYTDYFNVIIVDECAHAANSPTQIKHLGQIVDISKARYVYGLSATPYRADGLTKAIYTLLGLNPNGEFTPTFIINKEDTNTLTAIHKEIELNTPVCYDYFDIDGKLVYSELIKYLSLNEERQNEIIDNIFECSNKEYVNEFSSHKEGKLFRKQMVLCNYTSQAELIVSLINKKSEDMLRKNGEIGLRAKLLIGEVSSKKRQEILNDKEGKNRDVIVATYSLAKEGLDLPILSALHLATPQKDKATVIQSVGRIERIYRGEGYGKGNPVVFDYVDKNIPYCVSAYKKRRRYIKNRD